MLRNSVTALFVLAALLPSRPGAAQPYQPVVTSGALQMGQAFSSLSNTPVSASCVTFRTSTAPGSGTRELRLSHIRDTANFIRERSLSAAAALGFGGHAARADYQLLQSSRISRFSENLLVRVVYTQPVQMIDVTSIELNDIGRAAIASSYTQFLRQCGDSFVFARILGGEFSAVLTSTASTDASQSSSRAAFSGASSIPLGRIVIDAGKNELIQSLRTVENLQIHLFRDGHGHSSINELTVENIIRVRPGTFLFLTELSEHEANGCQPQEC